MPSSPAKRVLITGASAGLGRAMAQRLAVEHGWHVVAAARRLDKLESLKACAPDRIEPFVLDVTDPRAIDRASRNLDPLNGAILNAGITFYGPFSDGDAERDAAMIATNVTANVHLARALLATLTASQGRLLFIGSLGGLTPLPQQAVYSGTKAFIHAFALALREEVKGSGLDVGVFAPGGIETEMTDDPALDGLRDALADVDTVAGKAVDAFLRRKAFVIPGASNKLMAAAIKLLPRRLVAAAVARAYRQQ